MHCTIDVSNSLMYNALAIVEQSLVQANACSLGSRPSVGARPVVGAVDDIVHLYSTRATVGSSLGACSALDARSSPYLCPPSLSIVRHSPTDDVLTTVGRSSSSQSVIQAVAYSLVSWPPAGAYFVVVHSVLGGGDSLSGTCTTASRLVVANGPSISLEGACSLFGTDLDNSDSTTIELHTFRCTYLLGDVWSPPGVCSLLFSLVQLSLVDYVWSSLVGSAHLRLPVRSAFDTCLLRACLSYTYECSLRMRYWLAVHRSADGCSADGCYSRGVSCSFSVRISNHLPGVRDACSLVYLLVMCSPLDAHSTLDSASTTSFVLSNACPLNYTCSLNYACLSSRTALHCADVRVCPLSDAVVITAATATISGMYCDVSNHSMMYWRLRAAGGSTTITTFMYCCHFAATHSTISSPPNSSSSSIAACPCPANAQLLKDSLLPASLLVCARSPLTSYLATNAFSLGYWLNSSHDTCLFSANELICLLGVMPFALVSTLLIASLLRSDWRNRPRRESPLQVCASGSYCVMRFAMLLLLITAGSASPVEAPSANDDARWAQLIELAMGLAVTHGARNVAARLVNVLLGCRSKPLRSTLRWVLRRSCRLPQSSAEAPAERSQEGASTIGDASADASVTPMRTRFGFRSRNQEGASARASPVTYAAVEQPASVSSVGAPCEQSSDASLQVSLAPSPRTCPSPLPPPDSVPTVSEQIVCLSIVRAELAAALALLLSPVASSNLGRRQSVRTVMYARRREACCLAWVMLRHVPRHVWMALSFCYRLRARATVSERATARRAMEARRARVLELRTASPSPLTSYDVGVAEDGSLLYRSALGVVSSTHPAARPVVEIPLGSAIRCDGSVGSPLEPPADSSFDLCPDASGAICYVDRNSGIAQWDAPPDSSALSPRPLLACSFAAPPPCFPPGLGYAALHGTQWYPLYQDHQGRVCLYHAETGAVRNAPWICLRNAESLGRVFYVNLNTQQTRWLPPHRWMEGWMSRPNPDDHGGLQDVLFDGHRLVQQLLPLVLARQRTECGAPPLYYERGVPQFAPDADDTPDTHPLCAQAPTRGG